MDIKQIVNKGKAAAAHAAVQDPMHLLQLQQHANAMPLSEAGSERGASPHDSERSHYSAPRYNQMNGLGAGPHDMRYPSPTAMQNSMGMMQQPQYNGFMNGMQQENIPPPRPATEQVKAFPCSTCGKGFARRSDLARHGQYNYTMFRHRMLTI